MESVDDRISHPGAVSRYLPLIGWMAFISFASSTSFSASNTSSVIGPLLKWLFPNSSEETHIFLHFLVRKAGHFLEYAILGFLAGRAFSSSPKPSVRKRWMGISAGLIIVYALLDEFHQSFVPSRTASFSDSLVDISGGITALMIFKARVLKTRLQRMRSPPTP
jgi:VanZ family protein